MRRVLTNSLAIFVLVASLGAAPRPNHPDSSKRTPEARQGKAYQVGKASWYGKYFHGRVTASGEPYDMFQFTAAHRKLPLGTLVWVTNLRNGKSIIVRINDRGPVPQTRIIDLSYGAAQVLRFRDPGLARVRLDLIRPEQTVAEVRGDTMVGMP